MEFQNDLPFYLKSEYPEIKEMALIAAGNQILGKPEDILQLVEND